MILLQNRKIFNYVLNMLVNVATFIVFSIMATLTVKKLKRAEIEQIPARFNYL